jgi:hypothetical protein
MPQPTGAGYVRCLTPHLIILVVEPNSPWGAELAQGLEEEGYEVKQTDAEWLPAVLELSAGRAVLTLIEYGAARETAAGSLTALLDAGRRAPRSPDQKPPRVAVAADRSAGLRDLGEAALIPRDATLDEAVVAISNLAYQRADPRRALALPAALLSEAARLEGSTRDFSAGGMRLRLPASREAKSVVIKGAQLTVDWTVEGRRIREAVAVRWFSARRRLLGEALEVGVQFGALEADLRDWLSSLAQRSGAPAGLPGHGVRFGMR